MTDIAIEKLNDDEARRLYERLGLRLSRSANARDLTEDQTLVWNSLIDVAGNRPLGAFLKEFGIGKFRQGCDAFLKFMRSSITQPLQHTEEVQLIRLLLTCVVRHLRRRSIPVSPSSVMKSLAYIDAIVDNDYPGYASSRMLTYLIKVIDP